MLFRRKEQNEGQPIAPAQTKRVLVIGSTGHPRVRCVRWDERDFPNVADHDAVVVNSVPLVQIVNSLPADHANEHWKRVWKNQEEVRIGLLKVLGAGRPVYVIDAAEASSSPERQWRTLGSGGMSNRQWMPVYVRCESEEGETLVVSDEAYRNYLALVSRWNHLYYIEQLDPRQWEWIQRPMFGRDIGCAIAVEHQPLAMNGYDRLVALKLWLAFHRVLRDRYGERVVTREPERKSGELVLLPEPTDVSDRDAVNVLLESFFGIPRESMPPEWTDEVRLPGEEALIKEDEKHAASVHELSEKRERIAKGISDLREYKRLLYETGPALEAICKRVLSELGASVREAEVAQEDFVIEWNGLKAVVEVKGHTRTVKVDDLRQLGHYRDEYRIKNGKEIKGILLGNAWRLEHPGRRTGRQEFTRDAIEYATSRGITLVTTTALYDAFCQFLDKQVDGPAVLRRLFDGSGVIKLV